MKLRKQLKNKFKINTIKVFSIYFSLQIILSAFNPIQADAKVATSMIQTLINPQTNTYQSQIITDAPGWTGKHVEMDTISMGNYLVNMCKHSSKDQKANMETIKKDPTECFNLDDVITLDSKDYNGYNFFMEAEGFKDSKDNLISDETQKKNAVYFSSKNNNFVSCPSANLFMPLSFPSTDNAGKNVTQMETDKAINISNILTDNLNSMLSLVHNGKNYNSILSLINESISIRPTTKGYTLVAKSDSTKNNSGYAIFYGKNNSDHPVIEGNISINDSSYTNKLNSSNDLSTFFTTTGYPNMDTEGNLLAYVIPIKSSVTNVSYGNLTLSDLDPKNVSSFIWAMPKGYMSINGKLSFDDANGKERSYISQKADDTPWITIHMISMYANNAYKNFNLSVSTNMSEENDGNWIVNLICSLLSLLITGLRTLLSLTDAYSLIYNKGARSSSSYNFGAMPDSWWVVVLRYHVIFQVIAWFIIICGVIKMLIDLNLSTINPGKRMSLYETIERYLLVGLLLVTIIPIVQFMLQMNDSIVKIFASQVDPNTSSPPVISSLAGIIIQIAYLGILIWINFTYIMRSIIIGILTAISPFFISTMAFSSNNKSLFISFIEELASNIFMQSVHAFAFAFLTNLTSTGGGLDTLVVSYSIIPITEMVRSLVFKGHGNAASSLGMSAGTKFLSGINGAKNVAGKVAGKMSDKLDAGNAESEKSPNISGSGGRNSIPETAVDNLNNGVNSKMDKLRNGLNDMTTKDKSHMGKAIGHGAKALNFTAKGLTAAGGAIGSITDAATDMAMAELTGREVGYGQVGTDMAKGAGYAGKALASAGGVAKETAEMAGQPIGAAMEKTGSTQTAQNVKNAISTSQPVRQIGRTAHNISGSINNTANKIQNSNAGQELNRIRPIESQIRNGSKIDKFTSGNHYQGTWQSDPRNQSVTNTLNFEDLNKCSNDSQIGSFYSNVRTAVYSQNVEEKANMQKKLHSSGVNVSSFGNNGTKVEFTKKYMNNNGISKMEASKDGKSMFITHSQNDNPSIASSGFKTS